MLEHPWRKSIYSHIELRMNNEQASDAQHSRVGGCPIGQEHMSQKSLGKVVEPRTRAVPLPQVRGLCEKKLHITSEFHLRRSTSSSTKEGCRPQNESMLETCGIAGL